MPMLHVCRGCDKTIPINVKRCQACQRTAYRARPVTPNMQARAAIYADPRWRACRKLVLAREPSCRQCGAPSTTADHYPIGVLECDNPFDADACRALCKRCSGIEDGARGWSARMGTQTGREPTPPPRNTWVA
jgi:hypothetical protein